MAGAMNNNQLLVSTGGRVELARDFKARNVVQSYNPGEEEARRTGGLTLTQLNSFLEDMEHEPPWRKLANKCADYYDNKQLDSDILRQMEARNIPPLICNMIKPTVDAVLGMEAKNRRDWMVTFGDDGQSEKVAQGINKKLNTAEREAGADRAISQSYGGQVKAGAGWVQVGRHSNPMRSTPYLTQYVHRREIWWDWRKPDEEDWRYLVRKQWFDEDALIESMPHLTHLIVGACRGWPAYALANIAGESVTENMRLGDSLEQAETQFTVSEHEWRDINRKRSVVYEVWYRKWKRGYVFRMPNGTVVEFDEKKPMHVALYQAEAISPFVATFPQVRQSMWIGPHRVFDRKTPYPHNHFPYVPFFGFREDTTDIPYGLIRTMISPQDEINARRSRIQALQGSRRAEIDDDALNTEFNTIDDAIDEISRADMTLILNKNRKNGAAAVRITDNGDLSAPMFQMLLESKNEIHQSSGLFPSMLGDESGAKSGIAINSLVEQSAQTLAEINDEYNSGRRRVGELFLSLIVEDSKHEHQVSIGDGKAKKAIYFNRPTGEVDTAGNEVLENDVAMAALKLELEDVPSTPTYRAQQFAQLTEITKALPPEAQKFVIDFVIEATDHKDRAKIARRLRGVLGIPEEGDDGEVDPAVEQVKAEAQAAIEELSQQLQMAMAELEKAKAGNDVKTLDIKTRAETADKDRQSKEAIEAAKLQAQEDADWLASLENEAQREADKAEKKETSTTH